MSNNIVLIELWCNSNSLMALDVSNNTALTDLNCSSNQLTSLNVANGNNAGSSIDATNNPNLTCIQVDNVAYSTGFWTDIDVAASFSLDCGYVVNIPDANFKTYLVGNTAINTNGDTEIQVSEAAAFAGQINCSGLSISDLTGIEAFTALTDLRCNLNSLTALDVSNNTALTTFYCSNNSLTSLNVASNTALTALAFGVNSCNEFRCLKQYSFNMALLSV